MKILRKKEHVTDYETGARRDGEHGLTSNRVFNLFVKIASVLIAFGIWIYASENDTTVENITISDIPIKIVNTSEIPLEIISGYNNTVDLTVEGKWTAIRSLTEDDFIVSADVSSITAAGTHTVPVNIISPDGTNVVSQSSSTITVYMDTTTSVSVPVKVVYDSYALDDGYELGEAIPNVDQITVTGPASVLTGIETAEVRLDLGRLSGSMIISENITLIDGSGNAVDNPYIKLQTTSVTVEVPVYIIKNLPLSVEFKYGYLNSSNSEVTIMPASVMVKGEVSALEGLDEITVATLDEKRISGETVQKIVLPEGVDFESEETTATVKVTHIGTELKSVVIDTADFIVDNPNNLEFELQSETLSVTLRGPADALAAITEENIGATLKLNYDKEKVSGALNVPVEITISGAGTDVYEIGEYTLSVKIGK